ncbi:MAG: hypothetical protein WCD25_01175 [Pseudolabrys sp.]
MPTQNIFDNGGFVSLGLIGLDISATQRPEVIQNNMNGDIKWLTGDQRGLVTHDTLHDGRRVGCPDQNVPSIARVAAFGFLTLIQVFDGSLIFVTRPVSDCNVGAQSQTDEEEH